MAGTRHRAVGTLKIVLVTVALWGCHRADKSTATPPSPVAPGAKPLKLASAPAGLNPRSPKVRVTNRKANHKGAIFVAEWHHIAIGKTLMHRSPKQFRGDLQRLYDDGFRPVTAKEWLDGRMDLPPGATPVVMTFDDANPDQFQLLDDGSVDPNCGVGIWLAFAKDHPDFPVKGTFFVLPMMWGQPKWVGKKIQMLRGWGSELASHTITHPVLRHLSDAKVEMEIGNASLALERLGEPAPFTLAYPYGSTPKDMKPVRKGFMWKGKKIEIKAAFLVGADPSPMPSDKRFDRYKIPRIQACPGPFGLDDWLTKVEKGTLKKVYVE